MSHAETHPHPAAHSHGTRRGYLIGFGLSALLTAVPFWLTMTGTVGNSQTTMVWVIGLAFVQIIVHTICFLHVSARSEGGWTLLALIFTVVIAAIAVTGSLWIMFHLNSNMIPMTPEGLPSTP